MVDSVYYQESNANCRDALIQDLQQHFCILSILRENLGYLLFNIMLPKVDINVLRLCFVVVKILRGLISFPLFVVQNQTNWINAGKFMIFCA